jgi:hypothetical protein
MPIVTNCFLPIHIYEGGSDKPVAMILREGKTPSGRTCAIRFAENR